MFKLDDDLVIDYLTESGEQLSAVETDLLAMEEEGAEIDEERVDRVFRAVHSIKGGSCLFDLTKIGDLAQQTENLLSLIRSRKKVATPDRIAVLLRAIDRLNELIQTPETSNQADIAELAAELGALYAEHQDPIRKSGAPAASPAHPGGPRLRILLVEDDFTCRLVLQTFLARYGECHIAVNGREAVEAFCAAIEARQRYDLICMDIMMPEMDGREAVRRIRALEEESGIQSTCGVKIVMTTTVEEVKEVILCFKELCDAYLMKPIDLGELLRQMKLYQLV
jgi:two-component system chemotaxis response regulator CheY